MSLMQAETSLSEAFFSSGKNALFRSNLNGPVVYHPLDSYEFLLDLKMGLCDCLAAVAQGGEAPHTERAHKNLYASLSTEQKEMWGHLSRSLGKLDSCLKSINKSFEELQAEPLPLVGTVRIGGNGREIREICSLIQQHRREPGDPSIKDRGVVISDYDARLLETDISDGAQIIVCYEAKSIIGISVFHPPEACPNWLMPLNARFNDSTNASLALMLVSPDCQGTGIFEMLMNATMVSAAALGASHLTGWVEHTNERAIRAYGKYNGAVDREITSEVSSPTGKVTSFIALRIPLPMGRAGE